MKVYCKRHRQSVNEVVAVCDIDLLGKSIKNNKMEIKVSEQFYKGDLLEIEDVLIILERSANFNIVGKKIIDSVIEKGIISPDGVLFIDDIPFAMKINL